jgi:hypothetical protein
MNEHIQSNIPGRASWSLYWTTSSSDSYLAAPYARIEFSYFSLFLRTEEQRVVMMTRRVVGCAIRSRLQNSMAERVPARTGR